MGIFARSGRRQKTAGNDEKEFAISKGQVFGLLLGVGFLGYLVTSSSIRLTTALIAGVAGVGFFVLFFASMRNPELPLYGLVAYLPFSKILPGDFGGAAAGVNMTNLFMAMIIVAWMASSASKSHRSLEGHPLHWPVLLFTLWGVLSFAVSTRLGSWVVALYLADMKRWLDPVVIYFMFFNVVHDKKKWKTIVIVLLIGVFMAAASAVVEYQTDSGGGSLESSRIGGIAEQPNILGAFFVYYMFIYLAFWLENMGKAKGWLSLLPFLICFRGIMVTFSRGAYLAFAQGLLGLAFFKNKVLFALACGGIAFLLLNPVLLPPGIRYRLESTFSSKAQLADPYNTGDVETKLDKSSQNRLLIWGVALNMMQRHPWVGIGFGQFKNTIGNYSDEIKQIDAHNAYVILAAELGLPALAFFILMLGMLMWFTSQVYYHHSDPFIRATALGFLGGLSGLLMANMFGSRLNSVEVAGYFWILAALMARAHSWVREEQQAAREAEQSEKRVQRTGAAAVNRPRRPRGPRFN